MGSPAFKRKQSSPRLSNKNTYSPSLKTQKLDEGAITIKSVLSEMKQMEERLQTHSELMFNRISSELNLLETKLVNKIEAEIKLIKEKTSEIEDRIAVIERELPSFEKLSKEIDSLKKEINNIKTKQTNNTVKDITSDAIIFGISFTPSENLKSIFNQVCRSIDYLPPQLRDIFRVKPKTADNKNTVVIAKFYTPFDRNRCLKAFSEYRKKSKGSVSMRSAGFDSNTIFRIYESLDAESRILLQKAVQHKIQGKFVSVFSAKGKIYVRLQRNADAVHIADEQALEEIVFA